MHDMAETLDNEPLRNRDRTGLADPAYIVAAKVNKHQMLGYFFFVGQQFLPKL